MDQSNRRALGTRATRSCDQNRDILTASGKSCSYLSDIGSGCFSPPLELDKLSCYQQSRGARLHHRDLSMCAIVIRETDGSCNLAETQILM